MCAHLIDNSPYLFNYRPVCRLIWNSNEKEKELSWSLKRLTANWIISTNIEQINNKRNKLHAAFSIKNQSKPRRKNNNNNIEWVWAENRKTTSCFSWFMEIPLNILFFLRISLWPVCYNERIHLSIFGLMFLFAFSCEMNKSAHCFLCYCCWSWRWFFLTKFPWS